MYQTDNAFFKECIMCDKRLELRVEKLEKNIETSKKKDGWDKFTILATLLVPISIALAGYFVSSSIKQAELQVAKINAKVSQAELVHSFLEQLTGKDPIKRKLAMQAVLIALPEEGPTLLEFISKTDSNPNVRKEAIKLLQGLKSRELIPLIFNSDPKISDSALEAFRTQGHPGMMTLLSIMRRISKNLNNKNGVINALVILGEFGPYYNFYRDFAPEFFSLKVTDKEIMTRIENVKSLFFVEFGGQGLTGFERRKRAKASNNDFKKTSPSGNQEKVIDTSNKSLSD